MSSDRSALKQQDLDIIKSYRSQLINDKEVQRLENPVSNTIRSCRITQFLVNLQTAISPDSKFRQSNRNSQL